MRSLALAVGMTMAACGGGQQHAGQTTADQRPAAERLAGPTPTRCGTAAPVSLQVLGSGGPIPDDGRASSGYLLWVEGASRLLVDVGGGVFTRFGEAGASIGDLDAIALSHLHALRQAKPGGGSHEVGNG